MSPFDSPFTAHCRLVQAISALSCPNCIQLPQVCTLNDRVAVGHAQLTYVKTKAEADTLAKARSVKCYHSRQCHDENVAALRALSSGNPIIATYGLGVGVNLMSNGQAISTVDHHGVPYSAASLVQLIGRIRRGGKFRIFVTAEELSRKVWYACCDDAGSV